MEKETVSRFEYLWTEQALPDKIDQYQCKTEEEEREEAEQKLLDRIGNLKIQNPESADSTK